MISKIAVIVAMMLPATTSAVDLSLTGKWKAESAQVMSCDKPVPAAITEFQFDVLNAPYLNRSVSSPSFKDANVTATATMTIKPSDGPPSTVISGLMIGQIVKNARSAVRGNTDGLTLEGYIVSKEQYGAWVEHKLSPPSDAGEVELQISGNALSGYTLSGMVRSGDTCSPVSPISGAAQDLTGIFGRGVPAKWSAKVVLKKL